MACTYDRAAKTVKPPSVLINGTSPSQGDSPVSAADDGIAHSQESKRRRKLELDLFYHYVSETGPSLAVDEVSEPFIGPVMCNMALQSDAVLYGVCLISALHRAKMSNFTDMDSLNHYRTYLSMALNEHNKEIARLSVDNVDSACLTSSLFRVHGFIRLQDRSLEPYTPPIEWLRMTGASNVTFRRAYGLSKVHPNSIGLKMMSSVSYLIEERRNDNYSHDLRHLLQRQGAHELSESWDDEIADAYKMAVNCIGLAWKSINSFDPPGTLCRRLIVFPMMVDKRFLDLVEERRPRALVILAHYFALLNTLSKFWWVSTAGSREVLAIQAEVSEEWQVHLELPLAILKDPSVLVK